MHGLQVLDGLAERDRVKRATEAAKNELESYIIRTRERLEGDAAWEKATTPRERKELGAELAALEEWIYDGGEAAAAAEFESRLGKVKGRGDAVARRVSEAAAWPGAARDARDAVAAAEATLEAWATAKPWINETDKVRGG